MNLVRRKILAGGLLAVTAVFAGGCASSEQLYENVSMSRDRAYQQWQNQRQMAQQMRPVISGSMSLADCLKVTIVNNKTLQSVVEEKEISRGQEMASYSAILPSLSAVGSYRRLDEVSSFSIPGGQKVTIGDLNNYSAGLRVTQPLFAGGSIGARLRAGKLFSLLTDQRVKAAFQEVIYESQHSYNDVLLNQHLFEISTDAVRSAQAHLEDVQKKRAGGVASDFDVLRAEVELSNFNAELIRNKNAINVSKSRLVKVMGASQDSDFELSDELEYEQWEIEMQEAVQTAFKNRPDLFQQEFDIRLQQELLRVAQSRYWPSINGFYDNTWSRPDPHRSTEIEWGRAWQTGFEASFPVFDGFAREGDVLSQKARVRQSQVDLIDTEETALFELAAGLLSIKDAEEFVQSQRLNLVRAQEGLRLAEVGYREGTNTQVEVIDAQAALTRARALYYESVYSHIIAKLVLRKAMGTLAVIDSGGAAKSE
ncbi:MAG TPA: TolC family protein [Sedimentisphaerales bacterium]|nr:TolC family protein [Sedimentisphaerales bacterium]